MKAKIIGILVVTLLIATAFPAVGTMNLIKKSVILPSQVNGIEWEKNYGGPEFDMFRDVIQTSDGYIMSGETEISGNKCPWVLKIDSEGNELWNWSITEFEHEEMIFEITLAYSEKIIQVSDGGYVITSIWVTDYNEEDYTFGGLIKLNANGEEEWIEILADGFEWTIKAEEVIELDDGFILVGHSGNPKDSLRIDAVGLCKTDLEGVDQWHMEYEYSDGWDASYAFCKSTDGGYLIAGYTELQQYVDYDLVLIKTDVNGNKEWEKIYGGLRYQIIFTVYQTSDNGYIMAGFNEAIGAGLDDAWLLKTDSSGNMLWEKTYGGRKPDQCWDFDIADDGFLLCVTLNIWSTGPGDRDDIQLIKTDNYGNIEWTQMYGGPTPQFGGGLFTTSDGGCIVCGFSGGGWGSNKADALLVKYSHFENQRPNQPDKPTGDQEGEPGKDYTFSTSCSDPDNDDVMFMWDWGDGNVSDWLETSSASYNWSERGDYLVKVMARDEHGGESDWSEAHAISIPRSRSINIQYYSVFQRFLDIFPLLKLLLERLGI